MSKDLLLLLLLPRHSAVIATVIGLLCTAVASIVGASPLIGVVVAFGIIAVALAFSAPHILLFVLLVIRMSIDATARYFTVPINTTTTLTLPQLLGIGVFILGVIIVVRERERIKHIPLLYAFILLIAWTAGSFFVSISPSPLTTTLYDVLRITTIFTIYILAFTTITSHQRFYALLITLLTGSLIPLGTALIQSITNTGYTDIVFDVPRVFGTFMHPNIFSTYLIAMVAVSILMLYTTHSRALHTITILLIALYSTIIIFTFARVSWIALFVLGSIIAATHFKRILPFVIALPLLLYVTFPAFHARVTEALHPGVDSSITWRIGLWNDTITRTIIDNRMLYGNGAGTFSTVAEGVRGNRFGSTDPHNEYVRSFVEGGIVGLSIFLLFVLWTLAILLYRAYTSTTQYEHDIFLTLFALALALAFASLSDHIFRSTPLQWIFFALVGSAFALFGPSAKKHIR